MSDPSQIAVRVQALGGQWQTLGAEHYRGVVPEGVQYAFNSWGPDTCSFNLRRDPGAPHPDISAWTPVEVEVAGVLSWDGRVKETPASDGADPVISVQCEGWQYHLDDDVFQANYVHTRLGDYGDLRARPTANLTTNPVYGQISNDDGAIVLTIPNGTVVAANTGFGVIVDLGSSAAAKRVVVTVESSNNSGSTGFYVIGTDTPYWGDASRQDYATGILNNSGASFTAAGTTAAAHRYVTLLMFSTVGHTPGADVWFRIRTAQSFAATAYESGGASILKADQIVRDVLGRTVFLTDTSGVQAGAFSGIPEMTMSAPQSFREVLAAANAWENYDLRVVVGRRVVFAPRATAATIEVGEWSGADFQDASFNSGEDVYNRALVQGTGPDGVPLTVERLSAAAAPTIVDRRGFTRTKILPAPNTALTTTAGQRIGDLYLGAHRTQPFRGSLTITGQGGARRVLGGGGVHPGHIGGERIVRCSHRIDPDTGGQARDGQVAAVSYNHDALAAQVSLDENRAGFEALLARYSVIVGQRP